MLTEKELAEMQARLDRCKDLKPGTATIDDLAWYVDHLTGLMADMSDLLIAYVDKAAAIERLKELLTRARCGNEGCCYPVEPIGGFIWCEWCRRKHTLLAEKT